MNIRPLSAMAALVLLVACNDVTGQKDRGTALKTHIDSVSYGIGTDIGHQMKMSGMDSLNTEAIAAGMRDGLDSTERIPAEQVRAIIQAYQMDMQKRMLAEQQKEAEANMRKGEAWLSENGKKPGVTTTASGLQYEVLQAGTGPKPVETDSVKVNYRGTLLDGTEFDSSYKYGQPAKFALTQVMQGWVEALTMMPAGSRWKVYIPANLAYGATTGPGGRLPPYSTLIFEVELLEVVPGPR